MICLKINDQLEVLAPVQMQSSILELVKRKYVLFYIDLLLYLWLSIFMSMCPVVSSLKKTAFHIVVNEFLTPVFCFYQIFSQFQYFLVKKRLVNFL